ncbi:MAG TPA: ATP-binding protein [Solirubrobacteraceae bacterium]|nr:ATP-binding protein [Solirubrobacteraceae bacterium]
MELELARDAQAPGAARAAASELCAHTDMSEACRYTLLLLVSELVTNAVLHSNARPARPVSFAAHALAQEIRVEVGDGGSGFTREDAARARGGWGLRLVDKEARSWGVEHARGTRVWFELALA